MEWISVKDRLPKAHNDVKIKLINGSEHKAYRSLVDNNYNQLGTANSFCSIDVTHWMPLPEKQ